MNFNKLNGYDVEDTNLRNIIGNVDNDNNTIDSNSDYAKTFVDTNNNVIPITDQMINLKNADDGLENELTIFRNNVYYTLNIDGLSLNAEGVTNLNLNLNSFVTCETLHDVATKSVTVNGFTLRVGSCLNIRFTSANTSANPLLSVNGETAKAIYIDGSPAVPGSIVCGHIYRMIYDGSHWEIINPQSLASTYTARNLSTLMGNTGSSTTMKMVKSIASYGMQPYSGLGLGDYYNIPTITTASMSGITYPTAASTPEGGTGSYTGQTFTYNSAYNNTTIQIAGFDQYYKYGATEQTHHHILFDCKNCITKIYMNPVNINYYGYPKSYLRKVLDGSFKNALNAALGFEVLAQSKGYEYSKSTTTANECDWDNYYLFLPQEGNLFGKSVYSYMPIWGNSEPQWQIYKTHPAARQKHFNGGRWWYWEANPALGNSAYFCYCYIHGYAHGWTNASTSGNGLAFAFLVG